MYFQYSVFFSSYNSSQIHPISLHIQLYVSQNKNNLPNENQTKQDKKIPRQNKIKQKAYKISQALVAQAFNLSTGEA